MKVRVIMLFVILLHIVNVSAAVQQNTKTAKNKQSDKLKLTCKEAVFLALRNNAKVKSAEIGRVSQKYAVVVAKHSFRPQYSLQGSYQYYSSSFHQNRYSANAFDIKPKVSLLTPYGTELALSMNNPITNKDGYIPSLTFEITQPLIKGFGKDVVEASLRNALDNEEINKLNYKEVISDTINTVVTDYINLARAKENLKISQISMSSYQAIMKKAQALIKAGRMAKNDIVQVEAQVAFQDSIIESNKNELMKARGKLLNTLGLDNQTNLQVPENIDYAEIAQILITKNGSPTIGNCKQLVLKNNSSYQVAGIMLKILGRSLLVAKNSAKWQLDLIASANRHGRGDTENSNINNLIRNKEHSEKIAVNLSIPINDVNAKQNVIDAQVALDQSYVSYQQLKRQLELDVITIRDSATNAKRQLDLSKQALKLQRRTVELAELKYNVGRISNFELLNHQRDLTTLQQGVVNNQANYINTLTVLNKILGETLDRFAIQLVY